MSGTSIFQRWGWTLAVLPMLASASSRGLWAPDEPRYAEVAREIWSSGDPIVMHLCGEVYPDKPPLMFWISGWLGHLTGWSELAMRLPSIFAMLGIALLVQRLARAWWSATEAAWAPWIFLTTALTSEIGGRLQLDPLLALFTTLAVFFASGGGCRRPTTWQIIAGGICLGLGGLTKGPVAWLDAGVVLLLWIWLSPTVGAAPSSRSRLQSTLLALLFALLFVALAVAPVAAWAAAAIAKEPSLAHPLLVGEHLGHAIEGRSHHGPFWQPAVEIAILLLPWSLPVAAGLGRSLRERNADPGAWRASIWLLSLVLCFSLFASKRPLYLLPAYPAAALLAARWIGTVGHARTTTNSLRWLMLPSTTLLIAVGLACCLASVFSDSLKTILPDDASGMAASGLAHRLLLVGLPVLPLAALAFRAALRRHVFPWGRYQIAAWCTATTLLAAALLPWIDRYKSPRFLAQALAHRVEQPRIIPCVGVRPEGYRFYSGRKTVEGRLLEALATEQDEFLALIERRRWEALDPGTREGMVIVLSRRVGSRNVCLVTRRR